MKVLDVNVLCYVVNQNDEYHPVIRDWWTKSLQGSEALGLPWVVVSGFLRISTNPRVFQKPLKVADALARVEAWIAHPSVTIISETPDHWPTLRQLIQDTNVSSKMMSDAHVAALAISRNATLVSCDRDFARFRQLRWENPAA